MFKSGAGTSRDANSYEEVEGALEFTSLRSRAFSTLKADKVALVSVSLVLFLIFVAIFAPLFAPKDPLFQYPDGLSVVGAPQGLGRHFILGADQNGRDVLSRLIYGARVSLTVGIVATALASFIGVTIGAISGYLGGWVESVLMRLTDIVLSFPILLFCIALIAVTGPSTKNVVLVIAFAYWTYLARIIRSQVLSLKEREFVIAARSLGLSTPQIIRRHIIPHLIPTIIVYSTLGVATSILIEASLSFLGIGVPLPQPSWGEMISEGQKYFQSAPWLLVAPGMTMIVAVLAFNLMGDWLTDLFDTSSVGVKR